MKRCLATVVGLLPDLVSGHDAAPVCLQKDGLDIKAMPEFVPIIKDGNPMSGLQFNIIVENAM